MVLPVLMRTSTTLKFYSTLSNLFNISVCFAILKALIFFFNNVKLDIIAFRSFIVKPSFLLFRYIFLHSFPSSLCRQSSCCFLILSLFTSARCLIFSLFSRQYCLSYSLRSSICSTFFFKIWFLLARQRCLSYSLRSSICSLLRFSCFFKILSLLARYRCLLYSLIFSLLSRQCCLILSLFSIQYCLILSLFSRQ